MEMTPFKIEVLLHYHCTAELFPGADCIAFEEAMEEFLDKGIFEKKCGTPIPNATAIECYVNALLTVPLPRKTWNVEMPKK